MKKAKTGYKVFQDIREFRVKMETKEQLGGQDHLGIKEKG